MSSWATTCWPMSLRQCRAESRVEKVQTAIFLAGQRRLRAVEGSEGRRREALELREREIGELLHDPCAHLRHGERRPGAESRVPSWGRLARRGRHRRRRRGRARSKGARFAAAKVDAYRMWMRIETVEVFVRSRSLSAGAHGGVGRAARAQLGRCGSTGHATPDTNACSVEAFGGISPHTHVHVSRTSPA